MHGSGSAAQWSSVVSQSSLRAHGGCSGWCAALPSAAASTGQHRAARTHALAHIVQEPQETGIPTGVRRSRGAEEQMTSEQQETAGSRLVYRPPSSTDVEYWGPGVCLRFLATGKDTNGAYTQIEHVVAPGGGPPPHLHQREDETWYGVEGRVAFRIGDVTLVAQPAD